MEVGEWVEVDDRIGFISYKNHLETSIKVRFGYRDSDVFSKERLNPVSNQMTNEQIHTLQLLAVEIGDKDWFESLGKLRS